MKESIGFVVVTYGMGKLQKTAKPQTFETLLGNGARSFSVKVMGCFFVKTLTLTYILFPYISFLLFHLYLYFWFYDGLFGFFLETETPFPSHLLKTAYAQKGSWGPPRSPASASVSDVSPPVWFIDARCAWPSPQVIVCSRVGTLKWRIPRPLMFGSYGSTSKADSSEGGPPWVAQGAPMGCDWVWKKQQTGMPSIPTNFHHSPGMSYCYYMLSLFGADCRYRQVVLLCADYMLMKLVAGRYQNRFVCFFFRTYLVFPVLQNPIGNTFSPNM